VLTAARRQAVWRSSRNPLSPTMTVEASWGAGSAAPHLVTGSMDALLTPYRDSAGGLYHSLAAAGKDLWDRTGR
jgi:hypothetical protein